MIFTNIVFAFADDWGKYASIYGEIDKNDYINQIVSTPNIDRIAKEGVVFTNANVPAPSCTPCRSSVCSGQYFWQTGLGAILQGAHWDENIPTFPLELEKNGYHIGYTYKVWSPGDNPDMPYGGKRNAYVREEQEYGRLGRFSKFSQTVTELSKTMSIEDAKENLLQDVRNNFTDFLNANKNNNPFCYWFGPTNTHRAWEKGSGKALWNINPDDLKGKMPKCLVDVEEIREDFADYLGEVQAFDVGVGVLISELEKAGQLDNTLFVVSGDHGIPGMPRGKCNLYNLGNEVALMARCPKKIKAGRVVDDLVNIMDLAPTFLDCVNVAIPKSMVAKSLWNIMLSDKNGQIEENRKFVVTGRERHVECAREGNLPYPQRAIRTEEFLYIYNFKPERWPMGDPDGLDDERYNVNYETFAKNLWFFFKDCDNSPTKLWTLWNRNDPQYHHYYEIGFEKRPQEELYDLRVDKDTVNNVAQDPQYKEVLKQHREQLFGILKEQNDPRVTEEDCRYEKMPYTSSVGRKIGKR